MVDVLPETDRVDAEGGIEPPEDAAPGTQLHRLRDRTDKARKERYTHLAVPGTGLTVRFTPIPETKRKQIEKQYDKGKGDDLDLRSSAAILAWCCQGVYEEPEDGSEPSEPVEGFSTPPKFGDTEFMAEYEAGNPVDACIAFYPAEGDVVGAARQVMVFSGYISPEAAEQIAKN